MPTREPRAEPVRRPVVSPGLDRLGLRAWEAGRFVWQFLRACFRPPWHLAELVHQGYEIGVRTLPLISLVGFITGLVFTKQSRPSLAAFGATSWLPSLITIALVRSLAPLITALICAGRVGSSIGAEIGSMKVTEQVDAMEVSALDPFKYLVVNRSLASMVMVPALTVYACLVGLVGAYVSVYSGEGTSVQAFLSTGFSSVTFLDLWTSIGKSFLFGLSIGLVSTYHGYHTTSGTLGVGRAANASVVTSMFVIFIEEILIVQVIAAFGGY